MIPTYIEFEAKNENDIKTVCQKLDIDYQSLTTFDVTTIYHNYGISIENISHLQLEEQRKKEYK